MVGCEIYNDLKSCQTLTNLCVLSRYDIETYSCDQYMSIYNSKSLVNNLEGWKEDMPWLYYSRNARINNVDLDLPITFSED